LILNGIILINSKMKKLVTTIFILFLIFSNLSTKLYSGITEELIKLDNLYEKGSITKKEYDKAKSIILNMDQDKKEKVKKVKKQPQKTKEYKSRLAKLDSLYKEGVITKQEYNKAKAIILEMEENSQKIINKAKTLKQENDTRLLKTVEIKKYKDNVGEETMELMEMTIGDFRVYSHRPGGIKVRRISDGQQLLVISDNLKVTYYGDSKDIVDIEHNTEDKNNPMLNLKIKKVPVLRWKGKYVPKHRATFYQVMAIGNKPFQYYIKLTKKGNPVVGLNISKFDRKIENAVAKAKTRLAAKYEISIDEINKIMKNRESKAVAQLESVIQKEEDKIMQASLDNLVDSAINEELAAELERTIGEAMANELISAIEAETGAAIDQAIQDELAAAIDQAVAEAVALGIDEATAAAAIQAMLEVYARGGTDAEAMAACQSIAGDAC